MAFDIAPGHQGTLCADLPQTVAFPSLSEQLALAPFVPRRLFREARKTSLSLDPGFPTLSARSDRALAKWLRTTRKMKGIIRASVVVSGRLRFLTIIYRRASEISRKISSEYFIEKALVYGIYTVVLDRKKGVISGKHQRLIFLPHAIQRACERRLLVCREHDASLLKRIDREACGVYGLISTEEPIDVLHAPSGPGAWVCRPTDDPDEWHVRTYLSDDMYDRYA